MSTLQEPLWLTAGASLCERSTPGSEHFIPFFLADPLKLFQTGCEAPVSRHAHFSTHALRGLAPAFGRATQTGRPEPSPEDTCLSCLLQLIVVLNGEQISGIWLSSSFPQFEPFHTLLICRPLYFTLQVIFTDTFIRRFYATLSARKDVMGNLWVQCLALRTL